MILAHFGRAVCSRWRGLICPPAEATPPGQAANAAFGKWLMAHQKEAGVFTTVAGLVDNLTDNPAAKLTAQEIAARVKLAQAGA